MYLKLHVGHTIQHQVYEASSLWWFKKACPLVEKCYFWTQTILNSAHFGRFFAYALTSCLMDSVKIKTSFALHFTPEDTGLLLHPFLMNLWIETSKMMPTFMPNGCNKKPLFRGLKWRAKLFLCSHVAHSSVAGLNPKFWLKSIKWGCVPDLGFYLYFLNYKGDLGSVTLLTYWILIESHFDRWLGLNQFFLTD